ncbi:MAG: sugar phosphate isomerase/epimerase [Planctomycetales bacterium]|nr:sugar phosphate isomerase/epimerase [Planctomycetales bacterium]
MMKSCVTISLVEEARGGPFVLWDGLPASCELARRLGYDAVEIFAPGPDHVSRPELRRLLSDLGLRLAAVGTGAGWVKHRLHLALSDAQRRREAVEFIQRMIDFGAEFGAPAIIGSMQGRSGDGVTRETASGWLCDSLQELGEYSGAREVDLIYEPLNRYETDQACTLEAGARLLSQLSTKRVRLLADLFHMGIEETNVAEAFRRFGQFVGHVHFVDSNRRPVGLGHTDFGPIVAALKESGYAGYLSAEAFPYPSPAEAAEQTMRAFRYWTSGL